MHADQTSSVARTARRVSVVALGLAAGLTTSPAYAEPPSTSFWEEAEDPSALEFLAIFVGAPLAIIAVLALLVYLPSMMRGQSSEPALVFSQRSEWFGGPRKKPDAEDDKAEREPTGGAGAQW
jgi:hypothetical protein